MQPSEQKFLSKAMQLIKEDVENKPFHMHGEMSIVADRKGNVMAFTYNPKDSVSVGARPGDKYVIHSHPPFGKPYDSSASEADHRAAAETYLDFNNKMKEYLTNGKDVLHIQPNSLELVKSHPDPKLEKKLGKLPEAFRLPDPQQPPYPFSNHEATVAFKNDWAPPAGWKPPEDYPRD